jgi:hypothetical protein
MGDRDALAGRREPFLSGFAFSQKSVCAVCFSFSSPIQGCCPFILCRAPAREPWQEPALWWAPADLLYWWRRWKGVWSMELMVILFLLVLINLLLALGRQQKKTWVRLTMTTVSFVLLLLTLLFVLKALI